MVNGLLSPSRSAAALVAISLTTGMPLESFGGSKQLTPIESLVSMVKKDGKA
jgi:hypothetical protein